MQVSMQFAGTIQARMLAPSLACCIPFYTTPSLVWCNEKIPAYMWGLGEQQWNKFGCWLCQAALMLACAEQFTRMAAACMEYPYSKDRLKGFLKKIQPAISDDVTKRAIHMATYKGLQGRIWDAMRSDHANHVLQLLIEKFQESCQWIVEECKDWGPTWVRMLAEDRAGCRILQRLLENADDDLLQELLQQIFGFMLDLSFLDSKFANYVAQLALTKSFERGWTNLFADFVEHIITHITNQQNHRGVRKFVASPSVSPIIAKTLEYTGTLRVELKEAITKAMKDAGLQDAAGEMDSVVHRKLKTVILSVTESVGMQDAAGKISVAVNQQDAILSATGDVGMQYLDGEMMGAVNQPLVVNQQDAILSVPDDVGMQYLEGEMTDAVSVVENVGKQYLEGEIDGVVNQPLVTRFRSAAHKVVVTVCRATLVVRNTFLDFDKPTLRLVRTA